MALIGILLAVGAGALSANGKAQAVATSAAMVSSAISSARELAISKNCRTRFIVMADSTANPEDWRMRRYGILKIKDDTADTTGTAPFEMYSRLEELPVGVFFAKNTHDDDETLPGTGAQEMFDSGNTDTAAILQTPKAEYAYIEFLPNGGTSRTSMSNILELGQFPTAAVAKTNIDKKTDYVRIGVAQYTGRVKVERPQLAHK